MINEKKPKIVIVAYGPHHNIGGTEKYNYLLINMFKTKGYDVEEILTVKPNETRAREKTIQYTLIPNFDYEFDKHNLVKKAFIFFKNKSALKKILIKKANDPNVKKIIFSCSFAFKNKRILEKSIFVQHFAVNKYKALLIKLLLGNPLKKYKKIVSFTENDCNLIKKDFDSSNQKQIIPIPLCGFDYNLINKNKITNIRNANIYDTENQICYIGTVDSNRKNIKLINDIAEYNGIYIYIYGPGELDFQKSKYLILKGPKTENEILDVLKNTKLLLISSKLEGFPFSIVQALNLGIPFVTTPCSDSMNFLSNNNNNGLISKDFEFGSYNSVFNDALNRKWNRQTICMFYDNNLSYELFEKRWLKIVSN